jgi:hypothetical protein
MHQQSPSGRQTMPAPQRAQWVAAESGPVAIMACDGR